MTRRLFRRPENAFLPACIVVLAGIGVPATADATEPNDSAAADPNRPRALYRQAEAAFTASNFVEARKLLLEAWGIRRTYDVAAALGQAELELKLYRDAAEHLDFAVQNFAPMESEGSLNGTKNDLRAAKSQVVEARITVNEPHAIVTANGRALGEAPLTASVFLEPGSYAFEATVGQGRKAERRLVLQKGGTYDVALNLPQASASPQSGLDVTSPRPSRNYVPSAVSAAVGGVAVVTGISLLIAASSQDGDREQLRDRLPGTNACGAGSGASADCEEISRLAWKASHFRTGAYVAFGTALAAGALTYLLWPSAPRAQTSLLLSPSYSPETRSVDLTAVGRF